MDENNSQSMENQPLEAQLVALANSATPSEIRSYEPTPSARKLAGALFVAQAPTLGELAAAAGLSESSIYRLLRDPAAVHWVVSHGSNLAAAGLGAVHARLLERALTDKRSVAAIKLYLERFDPEYQRNRAMDGAKNTQVNFFSGMSDTELSRFLGTTKEKLGFGIRDIDAVGSSQGRSGRRIGQAPTDALVSGRDGLGGVDSLRDPSSAGEDSERCDEPCEGHSGAPDRIPDARGESQT